MLTRSAQPTTRYSLVQTTNPVAQPVDSAYVLALLGFGGELPASEVSLVDTLIPVATLQVESMTSQALVQRTYRYQCGANAYSDNQPWWDGVQTGSIAELYSNPTEVHLPVYPLVSVESVTLFSETDAPTVVDTDVYYIDTDRRPGRIMLRHGQVWPAIVERVGGSFQVEFTAGHASSASGVPADLKWAVGTVAAYMYEHRGCDGSQAVNKSGARSVIDQARLSRL